MSFIRARPYPFPWERPSTALLMIDFQRDFMEPGGFGESLGNDVSLLRSTLGPAGRVLSAARRADLTVVHTREGHRPDLSDLAGAKARRGNPSLPIGGPGPLGRLLVRGQPGHEIVPELSPLPGEPVVDKPGKGAFYATDLDTLLHCRGIASLVVCGVTTEVCVHTTVREANDRGYDCLVVEDAVGSYFPEFQKVGLDMIRAQGGIFGWTAASEDVLAALESCR
jgi:nicotinamidase-related amidase